MSSGGGTNTVSQSSAPPAQFQGALANTLGSVQGVASTPLTQYNAGTNEQNLVAPLNSTQNQAFGEIGSAQGTAQPYINAASTDIQNSTTPLWSGVQQFSPSAVGQYESPYTSDVVNATQAEFNNQNAQQQQGVTSNAVSAGAWGGDRSGVAAGITAGQQELAEAPTIAGLENQGYSQALGEFNNQQTTQLGANEANSWLDSQAGANEANLGAESLNTQLSGANAELQSGGLQQQETQEQLNVPYEQYLQAQAYPFQTAGWLTSEEEGLSSTAGGTGTSTATDNPSPLSEIGGVATTGIGAAGLANTLGLFGAGAGAAGGALTAGEAAGLLGTEGGVGIGSAVGAGDLALAAAAKRGGALPARRAGGGVAAFDDGGTIGTLEDLDALGPGWAVGGTVPGQPSGSVTNSGLSPMGSIAPDVSASFVPSASGVAGHGMGMPHPTARVAQQPAETSPAQAVTALKGIAGPSASSGVAADTSGQFRKGGGVAAFDDGGDVGPDDDIAAQLRALPPGSTDVGPSGSVNLAPDDDISDQLRGIPIGRTDAPMASVGANVAPVRAAGPTGIAAPSRIDPSGVAANLNPGYESGYTPKTIDPQRAADIRAQAPWLGVLAAGAGMLGGRSTNGVANIGAGIEQGLQAYTGQLSAANQLEEKQAEQQNAGSAQKSTLDMDARRLSDAADEARKRLQQADTAETNTQGFRTAQLGNDAKRIAIEQQQANTAAIPPDVRTAQWLATATPDQKAAYQNAQLVKMGVPPNMFGTGAPAPAGGAPAPASSATSSSTGSASGLNEDYLKSLPPATQATIKSMVEGRMAPPTSNALSKPYWQMQMQAANQYDPSFDQTTWGTRNKTRQAFTAGAPANGITALNTALGHAAVVSDSFDQLGNGDTPVFNAVRNWVKTNTGDPAPTNAHEAVDALASEGRKVFSASGGGNLTELENWQQNFPINGSPAQQKGALKQFVSLLDSRLSALGDQYNRGMGKAQDPMYLLEPDAQKAYVKLTGRQPETQPLNNTAGQRGAAPAQQPAAAPTLPEGITPDMIQAEIARRAALRNQQAQP